MKNAQINKPRSIYCDGSAPNNQNGCMQGGLGVAIYNHDNQLIFEYSSTVREPTTNQRVELMAFIYALTYSQEGDTIYCDNDTVCKGYNLWMDNWVKKKWRKADNKPVMNSDLWRRVSSLKLHRSGVKVVHVRGHSGNEGNEKADKLASEAARAF